MTKQQQRTTIIVIAIVVVVVYLVVGRRSDNGANKAPSNTAVATFHGIPPEGSGGDPDLNRQKNRWSEPLNYRDVSVAQIIEFAHDELDAVGRKDRDHWSGAASEQAAQFEGTGVRVEGYLIAAKVSGTESCNGGSDLYHDDHVWLASSPSQSKRDAIVVEVTPFYNEQHPEWDIRTLNALARRHALVRVSGWILWDEEHGSEVGKSRGSLWEVHPITRIEVGENGTWHALSGSEIL